MKKDLKQSLAWSENQDKGIGIIPGPTIFIAAQVAVLLPLCIFTR
jgi:hypothetical protein